MHDLDFKTYSESVHVDYFYIVEKAWHSLCQLHREKKYKESGHVGICSFCVTLGLQKKWGLLYPYLFRAWYKISSPFKQNIVTFPVLLLNLLAVTILEKKLSKFAIPYISIEPTFNLKKDFQTLLVLGTSFPPLSL